MVAGLLLLATIAVAQTPDCGAFARQREVAATQPAVALECAAALPSPAQREFVLREAFLAAMATDSAAAARHTARLLDRAWVADAGFFPAARAASLLVKSDPAAARRLLLIAARRFPGVALRETETLASQDVFDAAAENAPDEAVGLAGGNGATAAAILKRLRASTRPAVRLVAALASDTTKPLWLRERQAVFCHLPIPEHLDSTARFFSEVASARIAAADDRAALYDRVLDRTAQMMFHNRDESIGRMSARDAYLAVAYGRTEQNDDFFTSVFDSALLPKLRRSGAAAVVESARSLRVRQFLAAAAVHRRLDSFSNADVVSRCVTNLDRAARPVDEALAVASVIEEIRDPRAMQAVLAAEYDRAVAERSAEGPAIYGLLAASLVRRVGIAAAAPSVRTIAARYIPFFSEPRTLAAAALFNAAGTMVQQHFFYDDDDGFESFVSFRNSYRGDPNWTWDDRGAYVVVAARGAGGRRIEIFANVPDPAKFGSPGPTDMRHTLARTLADKGRAPSMVVHRGHAYFVERTVRYLPGSVRLVFLGSCRGLENTYAVMSAATRAQVIATRAVGTLSVNDPLLKAINDELLRGAKSLDWERFWRSQEARLGKNAAFRDYIPPYRNGAAMFLAAYWECLSASAESN